MSWDKDRTGNVSLYTQDAVAHVTTECSKLYRRKQRSDIIECLCPFHDHSGERMLLTINIATDKITAANRRVAVGSWYCRSTGEQGSWNVFADRVGLERMHRPTGDEESSLLAELRPSIKVSEEYKKLELEPLTGPWERHDCIIKQKTLEAFDIKESYCEIRAGNDLSVVRRLIWTAHTQGAPVGHVELICDPSDPIRKPINSSGSWVCEHLLGLKQVCKRFGTDYVVLVEGPADALRMYQVGIPAIPMLGAKQWSNTRESVLSTVFDRVISLGDGDDQGRAMNKHVKQRINGSVSIPLAEGLDPASLEREDIFELKAAINKKLRS
jgi:5S rRNA maturation endonuclease (ribonuclease M5)